MGVTIHAPGLNRGKSWTKVPQGIHHENVKLESFHNAKWHTSLRILLAARRRNDSGLSHEACGCAIGQKKDKKPLKDILKKLKIPVTRYKRGGGGGERPLAEMAYVVEKLEVELLRSLDQNKGGQPGKHTASMFIQLANFGSCR